MIIDDDTSISDMLNEALSCEGYSVSRAYSGTEALMLLGQSKPDLVLLDLMEDKIARFPEQEQKLTAILADLHTDRESRLVLGL